MRQRRELCLRDVVRPHLPVAVPASIAHSEWASGLTYRLDTLIRLADRLRGHGSGPLPALRSQLDRAGEAILLERVTELRDND